MYIFTLQELWLLTGFEAVAGVFVQLVTCLHRARLAEQQTSTSVIGRGGGGHGGK